MACDASLVVMQHDGAGCALDVGRKTRTIPPHLRRALVEHWADGGATSVDNRGWRPVCLGEPEPSQSEGVTYSLGGGSWSPTLSSSSAT